MPEGRAFISPIQNEVPVTKYFLDRHGSVAHAIEGGITKTGKPIARRRLPVVAGEHRAYRAAEEARNS